MMTMMPTMTARVAAIPPTVAMLLCLHSISPSYQIMPCGQEHSPTILAASPPNQSAYKGHVIMIYFMMSFLSVSRRNLNSYAGLKVELVVLAVEIPVDPVAVVGVSAHESVHLPPPVVVVPPPAASVPVAVAVEATA